jgi:hypothetical protein
MKHDHSNYKLLNVEPSLGRWHEVKKKKEKMGRIKIVFQWDNNEMYIKYVTLYL